MCVNEPSFGRCKHEPNTCVAHELAHAVQLESHPGGPEDFHRAYNEAEDKYGYWDNPYELEAERMAQDIAARFRLVWPTEDPARLDNPDPVGYPGS